MRRVYISGGIKLREPDEEDICLGWEKPMNESMKDRVVDKHPQFKHSYLRYEQL
jgi:hypothetical protein